MKIGQETLNFNIDTGDDSQVITEEAFKQLTPKKHLSSEKASLSTLPPQQVDLNAWVSFMHEFMGDPGTGLETTDQGKSVPKIITVECLTS